jgi:hypothetical protein
MNTKRVLASLAGASLLLPGASATGASLNGPAQDPFHRPEQKPTKVGFSSFTLSPGQAMSSRSDVSIDGDYYHVILYVGTTTGGVAYIPDVSFSAGSNISQSELTSALLGVFVTNSTDFTDSSAMGSTSVSGTCLTKQTAANINWVPTATNVLVAVRLNKSAFDSIVARNSSALTMNVWLNSVTSCSGSNDDK